MMRRLSTIQWPNEELKMLADVPSEFRSESQAVIYISRAQSLNQPKYTEAVKTSVKWAMFCGNISSNQGNLFLSMLPQ